ncbi:MAG: 4Fe-4S dicluster domain-containing protein [Desulfovibrionaceae bacterium]|nr:4Fe-4S dicluster domain-containing protein [Desulfovibrionaceae bacterium]
MGGRLRRYAQAGSLGLFCLLLGAAESGSFFGLPADLFLRLDPLAGLAVPVVARGPVPGLFPALFIILLTLWAGRLFCGWLCPMGATLDAAGGMVRRIVRRKKAETLRLEPVLRGLKYLVLAAILGAAVCGVNLAFWASPLSLTTRLYALVLHPLGLESIGQSLEAVSPLLEWLGVTDWLYELPESRHFLTAGWTGLFWLALLGLELIRPRFWCRYLCPAGAVLGLFSRRSFRTRHVSAACTSCGRCSARCPAGIIRNARPTEPCPSECLACQTCVSVCPHGAVRYDSGGSRAVPSLFHQPSVPSRRAFCALLGAGAAGAALAGLSRADTLRQGAGTVIRPPGSRPEPDFLKRCLRCGECMKACPTGGLQPTWFQAGFSGIFTPFLDPRSGACRPDCTACGAVCPTQAILALPLTEKRWAKTGTAVINRKNCLAWAEDKRCMVCKENCPYGAVDVSMRSGHKAPVPAVHDTRCYGCGFCEQACPQTPSAIVVEPVGALRLNQDSFEAAARAAGLELEPSVHQGHVSQERWGQADAPPGFLE